MLPVSWVTQARPLVSRVRDSMTKAGDTREDLIGRLDPDEGLRSYVVHGQVSVKGDNPILITFYQRLRTTGHPQRSP